MDDYDLLDSHIPDETETSPTICRNCSREVSVDVKTCPYCQTLMEEPTDKDSKSNPELSKRMKVLQGMEIEEPEPQYHHVLFFVVDAENDFEAEAKGEAACSIYDAEDVSYYLVATNEAAKQLTRSSGPKTRSIPELANAEADSNLVDDLIDWGIDRDTELDEGSMFLTDDGQVLEAPSDIRRQVTKRGWLVPAVEERIPEQDIPDPETVRSEFEERDLPEYKPPDHS